MIFSKNTIIIILLILSGTFFIYGWANHNTHGIDLIQIVSRWIILKAVIVDDPNYSDPNRKRCEITIKEESTGHILNPNAPKWVPCNLPEPGTTASKGWIILNSRARDPENGATFANPEDDNSFITIHWIKWIQK